MNLDLSSLAKFATEPTYAPYPSAEHRNFFLALQEARLPKSEFDAVVSAWLRHRGDPLAAECETAGCPIVRHRFQPLPIWYLPDAVLLTLAHSGNHVYTDEAARRGLVDVP